jgi:hypothetical protein
MGVSLLPDGDQVRLRPARTVGAIEPDLRIYRARAAPALAYEGGRPDTRADQIRQRRGEVRLDIGGNLERDDLRRVASRRVLPSIDDHPLADEMGFAHRWRQPAFPGAAKLALAVTISGRLPPPVFLHNS